MFIISKVTHSCVNSLFLVFLDYFYFCSLDPTDLWRLTHQWLCWGGSQVSPTCHRSVPQVTGQSHRSQVSPTGRVTLIFAHKVATEIKLSGVVLAVQVRCSGSILNISKAPSLSQNACIRTNIQDINFLLSMILFL